MYTRMHYCQRRQWQPTPVLLPGKSHGRRSLVGCSQWSHKESDMTEGLPFHFHALEKEMTTHSSVLAWRIPGTGEPGGLLYGVAQSRAQLKQQQSPREVQLCSSLVKSSVWNSDVFLAVPWILPPGLSPLSQIDRSRPGIASCLLN